MKELRGIRLLCRLRWCRSTDLQTSTKTVVNDMTLKHQEMNDAIKKVANPNAAGLQRQAPPCDLSDKRRALLFLDRSSCWR